MRLDYIYTTIIVLCFCGIMVVFDFLPRSTYSPLEKRDLTQFPKFSWESVGKGEFTTKVNSWFSDTEPYRDVFLSMSMKVKGMMSLSLSDDDIKFHASTSADEESQGPTEEELEQQERNVTKAGGSNMEGFATIANKGIIVVGKGDKTRALMAYGGGKKGGVEYAESANAYKRAFPDVNVYCMVIPTAVDFYIPEKVSKASNEELPTINNIYAHLDPDVHAVNIYTPLSLHTQEDIYLRTDHHWAPLGAYYAAQEFAKVAKVPFKTLKSYTRKVVHRYVGSMYAYSKDISIKENPEDFVYFVPNNIKYTTTYYPYVVNSDYEVTGAGKPYTAAYFCHFKDGSGAAYCTFMGGDTKITKVQTGTKNHRRVMILKDSFGNALPGYLFYSFEEVHVIDYRYFKKNMRKYVRDNKITDILFANNIFNAYSNKISKKYNTFLNQGEGEYNTTTKKVKSYEKDRISDDDGYSHAVNDECTEPQVP